MTAKIDAFKCDRCLSSTKTAAPMFENATWLKLAKKHETLCAKCALARAAKRRVNLTFDDLLPCVFNLEGPWFDLFRGAEPPEKVVLPERAYAWQHAMLIRAAQIRGAPAALVDVGEVLAVDRNGLTLREAPEGGIYRSDEIDWAKGEKYLKVHQSAGDLAVEIFICFDSDNSARVREIIALHGPGSLGTTKVRSIFRLLQKAYPNLKTVGGVRMTGARLTRPEELSRSLHHITGTANATRAAA
jgi:hypothetical protein